MGSSRLNPTGKKPKTTDGGNNPPAAANGRSGSGKPTTPTRTRSRTTTTSADVRPPRKQPRRPGPATEKTAAAAVVPAVPANELSDGFDPITGAPTRPGGPGLYLHWDGRRSYRTRMPAPRVLEPDEQLSYGTASGDRVIEGDNLQVMVSLRSQYRAAVDVAYLDPPYNTGKRDFRYSDRRFHDPNADSDDAVYVSNEDGGRHTKWLNYMGPRLWLTWELLADHGVCFVSINDVELFRLGLLMDEIFGERNRLGVLVWKQAVDNNPTRIAVEHEYILCYAKRAEVVAERWQGTSRAKQWLLDKYAELRAQEPDPVRLEKLWRAAINAQKKTYRQAVEEERADDEVDIGRMDRFRNVNENGPWAKDWHLENPREGGYLYDIPHQ